MTNMSLRLNCERCGRFTDYEAVSKRADGSALVVCDRCGKRHGSDSVFFVDLHSTYRRAEDGTLLEEP